MSTQVHIPTKSDFYEAKALQIIASPEFHGMGIMILKRMKCAVNMRSIVEICEAETEFLEFDESRREEFNLKFKEFQDKIKTIQRDAPYASMHGQQNEFPEIPTKKQIVKGTCVQYFHGQTRFIETDYDTFSNVYVKYLEGIRLNLDSKGD